MAMQPGRMDILKAFAQNHPIGTPLMGALGGAGLGLLSGLMNKSSDEDGGQGHSKLLQALLGAGMGIGLGSYLTRGAGKIYNMNPSKGGP